MNPYEEERVRMRARREWRTGTPEERKQTHILWFVLFGVPIILGVIWNGLASLF